MRLLFTAIIAAGLVNGATIYTIVDLGPFNGSTPPVNGTNTTNLGGTSSYAYGINGAGSVVGTGDMSDGSMHAFLYSGDVMLDLNTLLAGNSGWVLSGAYSINTGGQIIGFGYHNGQSREFQLDPSASAESIPLAAPEPSTFMLLGGGLAMASCFRFRRRR